MAITKATLTGDGGQGLEINDIKVVGEQGANIVDAAAATAAVAALTGAANAAVTGVSLTDSTGGTASGSDTLVDETGSYDQTKGEANVATLAVAIEQNLVDIALILAQGDKSTVDVAAQKVELDKLITDVELIRVASNLVLVRLEAHGMLATS